MPINNGIQDQFKQLKRITILSGLPWTTETTDHSISISGFSAGHDLLLKTISGEARGFVFTNPDLTVSGHFRPDDYMLLLYNNWVAAKFTFESGLAGADTVLNIL